MPDTASSKVSAHAIKLYTNPGSRGKISEWVLSELKLPYETVILDMRSGEHKTPEYLEINPFGKVPAMEDGERICLLNIFPSFILLLHTMFHCVPVPANVFILLST
jgi:glutathione S-transferase